MARPRDPEVDRAIHRAAVELLARVGHHALTFDAVANRAGVARTSIYRRYDDVAELIEAAVDDVLPVPEPPRDDGQHEAWQSIVRSLRAALFDSDVGLSLLASLLVADHEQPELLDLWRDRIIKPRVARIADALDLERDEGQILSELALGGLIARYIARGHVTDADADELAELVADRGVGRLRKRAATDSFQP